MSPGMLIGIISSLFMMIFSAILMAILNKRRENLKVDEKTDEVVIENVGGRLIFYLMMMLWGLWTLMIVHTIMGGLEYDILGPISYFIITFLTLWAYYYGYGFIFVYNGQEIIKKSTLTGEKRYSLSDISEVIVWQYASEPGPSMKIKFNNGSKLKLHYWYVGFDYLLSDLRHTVPEYAWKDKRNHGGVRW
jgi:hypothetical protein